jgi:hypothetical protein
MSLPKVAVAYFEQLRQHLIDLNCRAVDRMAEDFERLYDSGENIGRVDADLAIMKSKAPIAERWERICDSAKVSLEAYGDALRGGRLQ